MQPAEAVIEAARLVHRHDDRELVYAGELEILRTAARRDVDDPGSSSIETSSHGMTRCSTPCAPGS